MLRTILDLVDEHARLLRRALLLLCCVGFASLGLSHAAAWYFGREIPSLRMSAGPEGTRRHRVASYLADEAARNDLFLRMESTAGTEECLDALKEGRLDVAMVSSGVVVPDDDDILVIGAVGVEAVHVLVRPELAVAGSLNATLQGRRINVGVRGSTEYLLGHDFLDFARRHVAHASKPSDIDTTELSKPELLAQADAILRASPPERAALIAELPDCLLVLDSTPATVVQRLVEAADYRIMPATSGRAYMADSFEGAPNAGTRLCREFLEPTTIPARSYYNGRSYPDADCETVGVRLLVVARRDVPASAIRPLMRTLFEGEFARRVATRSPREVATTYAMHPAAVAYLDRDKPLPIHEVVDEVKQALSLFGALSALALSIYGLLRRKKTRKPSDYFAEIRKIENLAKGTASDPAVSIQPKELAAHLDDRLHRLRQELVEDICEGRIKGDQVITNILALMKETRRAILEHNVLAATVVARPRERAA